MKHPCQEIVRAARLLQVQRSQPIGQFPSTMTDRRPVAVPQVNCAQQSASSIQAWNELPSVGRMNLHVFNLGRTDSSQDRQVLFAAEWVVGVPDADFALIAGIIAVSASADSLFATSFSWWTLPPEMLPSRLEPAYLGGSAIIAPVNRPHRRAPGDRPLSIGHDAPSGERMVLQYPRQIALAETDHSIPALPTQRIRAQRLVGVKGAGPPLRSSQPFR